MNQFDLQQSLNQQQSLSPQMQQGLKILQASTQELQVILDQAFQLNPVLEVEVVEDSLEKELQIEKFENSEEKNLEEDDWRDRQIIERGFVSQGAEESREFLYNSLVASKTLQQHLYDQLAVSQVSRRIKEIAGLLIGYINSRGFLDIELEQVSHQTGLKLFLLEKALVHIQHFDPIGVGAQDYKESFLIQLKYKGLLGSVACQIVENHMDALAKKNYSLIAKELGVSISAIDQAADAIGQLDLNPGVIFDSTANPHVTPDVIVRKNKVTGELTAQLEEKGVPRVTINPYYKEMMASSENLEEKQYLKKKIQDGNFLIFSLSQRQETLLKIIEQLLELQKEYFEKGRDHMKPLKMKEVADKIKIHMTTVSRAIAGKYVASPQGLLALKRFFISGVESKDGEGASNAQVKASILKLIQTEPEKKPYSDAKIAKLLNEQGVHVARRTIAKYRDQLNILPSNLRRKRI